MKINSLFIGSIIVLALSMITLTVYLGYEAKQDTQRTQQQTPGGQIMKQVTVPEVYQQTTVDVCQLSFSLGPGCTPGTVQCASNSSYQTCTGGEWGEITNCSSGQQCVNGICENYVCQGTIPPHSILCTGDATGLITNTPLTLVTSCTDSVKCEYQCDTGYTRSGTTCIPLTYTCTGDTPANSAICTGDDSGLTANTPKTLVGACTSNTKCEYICDSGYTRSGNSCVPQEYLCTGETPTNATLCTGDATSLTSNIPKSVVSSCTDTTKCEYTCNSGYSKSGSICVAQRCYDRCETDSECPSDLKCQSVNGAKRCVNTSCPDTSSCTCPTPTPTPTSSPTPSPTATAAPSPTPPVVPELPKAGGIPPTILFTIGGIILVALGLLF